MLLQRLSNGLLRTDGENCSVEIISKVILEGAKIVSRKSPGCFLEVGKGLCFGKSEGIAEFEIHSASRGHLQVSY